MATVTPRTTAQKVRLFRSLFTGLPHAYGTYDPATGRSRQVKRPVTDEVILAHLRGRRPYGVYLLVKDRVRAAAVDFDIPDGLPPIEFVQRAKHHGILAHIERSKSKGHHMWIFFEERGVSAAKARLVIRHLLEEIEMPMAEVFPKQDALGKGTRFGNFINAPLFGAFVPRGRTVFIDPSDSLRPYPNQWDLLESIGRIPESVLDDVIEINELHQTDFQHGQETSSHNEHSQPSFGLPPCAQRILSEGVTSNQRVTCFRLAVHLKRLGLPQDIAAATLAAWAQRNRPTDGKRVITPVEIEGQTSSAYRGHYRSCGCEDPAIQPFCEPECPIQQKTDDVRPSAKAPGQPTSLRRVTP